jgi:hypothetical protein
MHADTNTYMPLQEPCAIVSTLIKVLQLCILAGFEMPHPCRNFGRIPENAGLAENELQHVRAELQFHFWPPRIRYVNNNKQRTYRI